MKKFQKLFKFYSLQFYLGHPVLIKKKFVKRDTLRFGYLKNSEYPVSSKIFVKRKKEKVTRTNVYDSIFISNLKFKFLPKIRGCSSRSSSFA